MPLAVKVRVVPTVTVTGFGVTVIVVSVPAVMLTIAVPLTRPCVAMTILPLAGVVWAVKTPEELIVPPLDVHVGAMAMLLPN